MQNKKRRVVLQPVESKVGTTGKKHHPKVLLQRKNEKYLDLNKCCTSAEIRYVHSNYSFQGLLEEEIERAISTQEYWVRSPKATWIQEIIQLLDKNSRKQLGKLQVDMETCGAGNPEDKWNWYTKFATKVLDLWFESDPSVSKVVELCEKFGHTELASGYVLNGFFVDNLALKKEMSVSDVHACVEKIVSEKCVSVYRVDDENNTFVQHDETQVQVDGLLEKLQQQLSTGRGSWGSLNTTWNYYEYPYSDERELMDDYMYALEKGCEELDTVHVNKILYLIWKLADYCTPYHQDVHVEPHFTCYNQVSGVSTFHFLPLLAGLYANYVGRVKGPDSLQALMDEFGQRKIGQCCTIGPKEMLLILPFGSHGVFVPSTRTNQFLPSFETSVIRAAEILINPVMESIHESFKNPKWYDVLQWTDEELSEQSDLLLTFKQEQQQVCKNMGLDTKKWLWLTQRLFEETLGGGGSSAPFRALAKDEQNKQQHKV